MAGLIPIGTLSAAGDITTGANIDRDLSHSERAVTRRVKSQVGPVVAGVVADDPSIKSSVESIVAGIVDVDGLSRANISEDVDGTYYYDLGSDEFFLGFDDDGTPYVIPGGP